MSDWQELDHRGGGKKLTTANGNLEQRFHIEFTVMPELIKKLDKVKALLSTQFPWDAGFVEIFESLLDGYIERNDPERRLERRRRRKPEKRRPCPET
jgi:hypothetical protein